GQSFVPGNFGIIKGFNMGIFRQLFLFAVLVTVAAGAVSVQAQVSLTAIGTPYTQDFTALPASGSATFTNNSTILGWYSARTGTGITIVADGGTNNGGNLYSYGTGTATDRALGSLGSGNAAAGSFFWGVRLQNNTGVTVTSLTVSYVGEQWRNSAAATQTISFSYLIGSPAVTGSLAEFQSAGTAVAALNFTGPISLGAAGALDGNAAANRSAISFAITGISIPNGTEIMLRWSDPDHTGTDHGLSIDDFSVTPGITTAAAAGLSGRVLDANGRPISNALVTISGDGLATPTMAQTGPFGYYQFTGLEVGRTYVITVRSGRFTFAEPTRLVELNAEVTNADFVAEP
ncbi:MAG: carboxypeptidase-like regulatory domain-containing protein, partial [Pyrinomonadaceae bacterium]